MQKDAIKQWLKKAKEYEDEGSFVMGVAVVACVFVGLAFGLSRLHLSLPSWKSPQKDQVVTVSPTPTVKTLSALPASPALYQREGVWYAEGLPAQYIVQNGDSTWKIAEAIYGSGENFRDIEKENQLTAGADLNVGQKIIIPNVPSRKEATLSPTAIPSPSASPTVAPTATVSQSPEQNGPRKHTVQKGEGLWQIAQKYYKDGNQYLKIFNANKDKMKNPEDIKVGMELNIPE